MCEAPESSTISPDSGGGLVYIILICPRLLLADGDAHRGARLLLRRLVVEHGCGQEEVVHHACQVEPPLALHDK